MSFRMGAFEVWPDTSSAGPDGLAAFHVPTKRYWKQGRDGVWREDVGFMQG